MKIFLGIPCGCERDSWINPRLASFLTATAAKHPSTPIHYEFDARPVFLARNNIAKAFLQTDAKWLCTIDNDMRPPANLFSILDGAPADASIIVPRMFCAAEGNRPQYLAWGLPGPSPDRPQWQRLANAGTGVMFIRRNVFSAIAFPWFEFGRYADGSTRAAEDCVFCEKASRAGVHIYGNRQILCGHFRTVELLDGEELSE